MHFTRDIDFVNKMGLDLWEFVSEHGQEFIPLDGWMRNEKNLVIADDVGCFLFSHYDPGTYEVHTLYPPQSHALERAREAMFLLYSGTDAVEILTKVPENNLSAFALAKKMGFKQQFKARQWKTKKGPVEVHFMRSSIEDWVLEDELLPLIGEQFHDELVQLGIETNHEDDPVHDRYVGMAYAMVQQGMPGKAQRLYNRWATFYAAHPMNIISLEPLQIDIGTHVLALRDGKLCQLEQ